MKNFVMVTFVAVLGLSNHAFAQDAYRLSHIETIVQQRRPASVEDLLKSLPAILRSKFIIMADGRALQQSAPDNPRILFFQNHLDSSMFNENETRLILTVNLKPESRGGDSLEMLDFDFKTKRFIFQEVSFKDGKAYVSGRNPPQCMTCHRGGRPLWDLYGAWPGTFDGNTIFHNGYRGQAIRDTVQKAFESSPRTQNLEWYHDEGLNFYFGQRLGRQNIQRVIWGLGEVKELKPYAFAFYGWALDCANIDEFLPEKVAQSHTAFRTLADYEAEIKRMDTRYLDELQSREILYTPLDKSPLKYYRQGVEDGSGGGSRFVDQASRWARMRYLVEPFGVDTQGWGITLPPAYFVAHYGGNDDVEFEDFKAAIEFRFQDVLGDEPRRDCKALAALSRKALER